MVEERLGLTQWPRALPKDRLRYKPLGVNPRLGLTRVYFGAWAVSRGVDGV